MTVADLSRQPADASDETRWEAEVAATRLGRGVHALAARLGGASWTTCVLCDLPSAGDPRGRSSCCGGPLRAQGCAPVL